MFLFSWDSPPIWCFVPSWLYPQKCSQMNLCNSIRKYISNSYKWKLTVSIHVPSLMAQPVNTVTVDDLAWPHSTDLCFEVMLCDWWSPSTCNGKLPVIDRTYHTPHLELRCMEEFTLLFVINVIFSFFGQSHGKSCCLQLQRLRCVCTRVKRHNVSCVSRW